MLKAVEKEPTFHGSYHFLGALCTDEGKTDSSIYYYKKSIDLNKTNQSHTKEMTYVRLIDAYLFKYDFSNSFTTAWKAHQEHPENKAILLGLKDACLWSFHINHNHLDSSYLSPKLQEEYLVNSVPEEYLILRKIKVDGQYLVMQGQRSTKQNGGNYDLLSCVLSKSSEKIEVKFKLNWDMDKHWGGNVASTEDVHSDLSNPVEEIIGALLTEKLDLKLDKEIKKIIKKKK